MSQQDYCLPTVGQSKFFFMKEKVLFLVIVKIVFTIKELRFNLSKLELCSRNIINLGSEKKFLFFKNLSNLRNTNSSLRYEDDRVVCPWDNMEPWMKLKPTLPYGQLPCLRWNGELVCQSMTICRFFIIHYNQGRFT